MVKDFLKQNGKHDKIDKESAVKKLKASFKTLSRDMGRRKWTRESLYEKSQSNKGGSTS